MSYSNLRTGGCAWFIRTVFTVAVVVVDLTNGNDAGTVETRKSLDIGIVKRAFHERHAAGQDGKIAAAIGAHKR